MSEIKKIATRDSYGNALIELGNEYKDLVVLDADLAAATKTGVFKKAYPQRHIDCGIAECNMMGIAAGMVWNKLETNKELVKKGLLFFTVQLLLNALWSYLFFGLNNILLALIEIILLWLIIYETYYIFKQVDKKAGYLLIPYLAWVGFATILTGTIYWLNR